MLIGCSPPSARHGRFQARPVNGELAEHGAALQRPSGQLVQRLGWLGGLHHDQALACHSVEWQIGGGVPLGQGEADA
jgi:hypothetical protein